MKGMEQLFHEARLRMGPTREARLRDAKKRSDDFNRQCQADFEAQRVTRELLNKVMDL